MSPARIRLFGLVLLLPLSTLACKSKEEKACLAQAKWMAELHEQLGRADESPKMRGKELRECVAQKKSYKTDMELDDAAYEALLDCEIAARSMDEALDCVFDAAAKQMKAIGEELDRDVAAMLEADEREADSAIARLEAHVESGAVSAQTIADLRGRNDDTPPGRVEDVVEEAIALIESGRVGADNPITIRLQPGFDPLADEPYAPKGLDSAELSFVDRDSGATVARLAPINSDHLGAKAAEVEAMLRWMLEQPDTRRVELVLTRGTDEGLVFKTPPALYDLAEAFEQAGIADRPIIWLDGKPMTRSEYILR